MRKNPGVDHLFSLVGPSLILAAVGSGALLYRATAGISSSSETGNPWTMRFHSTFGFWKLTRRQTERPEARK